jgi:CRP-like cAMP-binding protein
VGDLGVLLCYVLWGMVRLRYAGLELSQIVTTSALLTAVLAFAMQDTLGNLLGGLVLQLDSSLKIGDWVRIDDIEGQIIDIHWRSTSVQTRNWDTVVIPNSHIMRNRFMVHGRRRGEPLQWRRWVWFNIDYNVPPAQVIQAAESAVRTAIIPNVASIPPPQCLLMEFEHGYMRYALRYWLTDPARDDPTDSLVREHVLTALQRAGMRIAAPEYHIYTVKEGEKHSQEVKLREIARRVIALKQVYLFAGFSEEELHTLAERLVFAPFSQGDVMTRQGAVAHWLYIVADGQAEVVVDTDGSRRSVSQLTAGTCFGEMGMLLGEPRRASVIARTPTQCYRLDKSSLEDIMHTRPKLAEELSHLLSKRQVELNRTLNKVGTALSEQEAVHGRSEILARIRSFFGLNSH